MKLKKIACLVLTIVVISSIAITTFAAPYQNYTVTEAGIYQEPQAYVPDQVIDSGVIGLENLDGVALNSPQDLTQFNLNEYIIISDTGNNRIVVLDKDMKTVKQIITKWDNNGVEDSFNSPNGLFMFEHENNYLYVCDTTNKRIVRFSFNEETNLFVFDRTYDDPDISKYFTSDDSTTEESEETTETTTETAETTATPAAEATATPEVETEKDEAASANSIGDTTGKVNSAETSEQTDTTASDSVGDTTGQVDSAETGETTEETTETTDDDGNVVTGTSSVAEVTYRPLKVVVDSAERLFVVSKDCYQGLVELDADGVFSKFFGATKTKQTLSSLLNRLFTASAKSKLQQNLSTEYSNVTMDADGFVYGTISQIKVADLASHFESSTEIGAALRKLNAAGSDVLQRQGIIPPSGDKGDEINRSTYSFIVDATVSENGLTSILDSQKGRVFTYSSTGELLYVFGSLGQRKNNTGTEVTSTREEQVGFTKGTTLSPVAIELLKDDETIAILDSTGAQITTYSPTEYGLVLRDAVNSHEERRYDDALEAWNKILGMSSNSSIAYRGIGKIKYLQASEEIDSEKQRAGYLEAADYFMEGYSQDEYGKAFYKYRDKVLEDIMPYLLTAIIVVVVLVIVINTIKKFRHFVKTGGREE